MKVWKLASVFVAGCNAERAKGKRGNLDQSKERYIWTTPRCLSVPEMCDPTCMQNFDSDTGKITIGPDEYTNMRNCLWRIEVSDQKTLQLQFNQTFGFGIEYHRNCAFDKIHVFDQNDNSRLARFCGPKDDLPYDGARKLRAIDGELEMWDLPFDSHTNSIVVGFDTDRDESGFAGFELLWEAKTVYDTDFSKAEDSLTWIQEKMTDIVNRRTFKGHGRSAVKGTIDGYIPKAKAAIGRKRNCARDSSKPISDDLTKTLKQMADGTKSMFFFTLADTAKAIVIDYIGDCKKARGTWTNNTKNLKTKFTSNLDTA